MLQEKVWQPKDIIYAKDVMMFKNPETKEIELWISGKNGFCKIESLDALEVSASENTDKNLSFTELGIKTRARGRAKRGIRRSFGAFTLFTIRIATPERRSANQAPRVQVSTRAKRLRSAENI